MTRHLMTDDATYLLDRAYDALGTTVPDYSRHSRPTVAVADVVDPYDVIDDARLRVERSAEIDLGQLLIAVALEATRWEIPSREECERIALDAEAVSPHSPTSADGRVGRASDPFVHAFEMIVERDSHCGVELWPREEARLRGGGDAFRRFPLRALPMVTICYDGHHVADYGIYPDGSAILWAD